MVNELRFGPGLVGKTGCQGEAHPMFACDDVLQCGIVAGYA